MGGSLSAGPQRVALGCGHYLLLLVRPLPIQAVKAGDTSSPLGAGSHPEIGSPCHVALGRDLNEDSHESAISTTRSGRKQCGNSLLAWPPSCWRWAPARPVPKRRSRSG